MGKETRPTTMDNTSKRVKTLTITTRNNPVELLDSFFQHS
jgi:hypothetical protein